MKKKVFSLMMMLVLAFVGVAKADVVTIGDPTSTTTNSYLPGYSLYDYSISQQIYTADEIGVAGTINTLTMWLKNSSSYARNFNIYMKEVSESEFASTSAWVSMTESDKVATYVMDKGIASPVETAITLSTPFAYSGSGNLVICFQDVTGQWSSGMGSVVMDASGYQGLYAHRDGTVYNVSNPGVSGYRLTVKSVVRLDITTSGGGGGGGVSNPLLVIQDGVEVDTIDLGIRPNGAWMRPIEGYDLFNQTGSAINVTRFDFTPEEGFFTAEAVDYELPFQMAIDDTIPMLFSTNVNDSTLTDGELVRQFVVIYDARTAGVWPIKMFAYSPVEPDVVELARTVDTFPYYDTLDVAAIPLYDNYRLPDTSIVDGPDAVYILTIDKDVLLNASVIEGEDGKVALYTEDFYEEQFGFAGPDMENNYQGPAFGENAGFAGDEFTEGFEGGLNGWRVLNINADGGEWIHSDDNGGGYDYTGNAHTGTGFAMCYSFIDYVGSYDTDSYLVSPQQYAITNGSVLTFWVDQANDVYPENLDVCISTAANPTSAADFTSVWTRRNGAANGQAAEVRHLNDRSGNWTQYSINLSAYVGQSLWIAFHDASYDMYEVWLDDVALTVNTSRAAHAYQAAPVIVDLPVSPGTYYLVASSTSPEFVVEINTTDMPCPDAAEAIYPLDDADDVQIGNGVTLQWKLDGYATEYCLLFGSTYYCEDTLVAWTSDLAESFVVPADYPLYHNTNYFWKVCQRNGSCTDGTDGEVWGFTTTFNAPTNLHATDASIFEGESVTMEWNAIQDRTFRKYNVYLNDSLIGSTTITPNPNTYLTYVIPASLLTYNMDPGHKVEVTAYYDEGESPRSEPYYIKVSGYGKITGKVWEQDGTTGIKNARVFISGVNEFNEPVEMETLTPSNTGSYTINNVPVSGNAETYQCFAEKQGYQGPVEPIEGNPRAVAHRGTTQANFILDEEFTPVPHCGVFAEYYPDPEDETEYVKVYWTMNGGENGNIDFETGDFSQGNFDNTVTANYPWVIATDNVHGGTYAIKSSNAGVASSMSAIEATVTLSYDGNVSFWALLQGEGSSTAWDDCRFYIDGDKKFEYGAHVSGWNEYSYDLTAGTHTLRWEYEKDSSIDPTGDGMWVDDIHFESAPGKGETADRSFQYYRIYRTSCFNDGPYNSENTVLLGNNDTPADPEFIDVNFKTVGAGVYKWGVSRVYEGNREDYPNGRESEISWTCYCIDKDMYLNNVRVTVLLNSADSPEGTTVTFVNLNEVEEQNHPMGTITLDETGYYKFGNNNPFRKGTYEVTVAHNGYITEVDTVDIWSNKHLRYVLTEIIYGTRNAYVSRTGWAMWESENTGGGGGGGGGGTTGTSFTEDFEAGIPADWSLIDADNDGNDWYELVGVSNIPGHNNSMGLVTSASYLGVALHPDNYLVTPQVTLGGTFSFWACAQDAAWAAEKFGVAVSTSGNTNASDFTMLQSWTMTAKSEGKGPRGTNEQGNWYQYSVDLSAYAGQTGYVAIRHYDCSDFFRLNVDDVEMGSAKNGGRHLEGFKVMCTNSFGEPIFNANTPADQPFCQVATDRLVEGQKYLFQVAAIYSTGMSPFCEPIEWEYESCENYQDIELNAETTASGNLLSWQGGQPGPTPPPGPTNGVPTFNEGWEGSLGEWTTIDADGDGHNWTLASVLMAGYLIPSHNGEDCMSSASYDFGAGALNPDNYLVSPLAAISNGSTFSFWACAQDPSYAAEHYGVAISTTGNTNAADFTTIAEWTMTAKDNTASGNYAHRGRDGKEGTWYNKTVDLSAYAGQDVYIAIRHFNCTDQFYLNVDEAQLTAGGKGGNLSSFNGQTGSHGQSMPLANRDGWYTYDDGNPANDNGIGTGGGNFYWGIMLPAGSYTENTVTKTAVYDYTAMTGTVSIYNDGSNAPAGSALGTANVTLTGSQSYVESVFAEPVAIDPTKNLWIVYYNGSGAAYPASVCANTGDPNGRWVSLDGSTWEDLYTYNLSYTWAIRAYLEDSSTPAPTPEGVIGYMIFRDGEWLAELPVETTSYLDTEGGGHDYVMRVIYGGDAILPSNNYYYAMSCGSEAQVGYEVVCEPGGAVTGSYYYETATDFGAIISWDNQPTPPPVPPTGGDEFTEGLEGGIPAGWVTIDADGDGFGWDVGSQTAHTGTGYVTSASYINNYGPLNPDNYLVTSQVTLGGTSTFSFWACAQDAAYAAEHFGVAVSTTGTNAADFTTIQEWTMTAKEGKGPRGTNDQGNWYQYTVDLSAYAGQACYIAIRHFNCTDWFYLNVDDIELSNGGKGTRANLTGYNIYRSTTNSNYTKIATVGADVTEYHDQVAAGTYYYQVTAVYDNDCESAPAPSAVDPSVNYVVIDVNSVDDNNNKVALYPNPTSGLVKIEAAGMNHITVVSVLGQVVYDNDVNADEYELNMAQFNTGVYVVRIATESGVSTQRVTVVR